MNSDESSSLWRSAKPEKQTLPICPPFYAWHVSDASDFSSHSDSKSDADVPQEKVVRNKAHRACDRCRELRLKCMKVNGEECSLCTKCVNSGQECTYLRPVGRPGPTPGAFKRTPTLRSTLFSTRRALSPDDYKESLMNGSSTANWVLEPNSSSPIYQTDARIVQPFVNLSEPYAGAGSRCVSGNVNSCSQEEASGSLNRILNTSWSCTSGAKSPLQQTVKADVRKSHRPLFWAQTRELEDSTTVRNKKHLFAD
ncbi:hypothetical protein FB446DRAFT_511397 [Lentinula raphanica]|nr:hypothetical protein FB446DRAFT_511397 [Lentinula raphanica]